MDGIEKDTCCIELKLCKVQTEIVLKFSIWFCFTFGKCIKTECCTLYCVCAWGSLNDELALPLPLAATSQLAPTTTENDILDHKPCTNLS